MSATSPGSLWRIGNYESLAGDGGLRYAARWHSAGRRIVYLAESPAGAMIEVLVHLELAQDELPRSYTLLQVRVPDGVRILAIAAIAVPGGEAWKDDLGLTRGLGDRWLAGMESALARVPSVILPGTFNFLLNPAHADACGFAIQTIVRPRFDPRLLRGLCG